MNLAEPKWAKYTVDRWAFKANVGTVGGEWDPFVWPRESDYTSTTPDKYGSLRITKKTAKNLVHIKWGWGKRKMDVPIDVWMDLRDEYTLSARVNHLCMISDIRYSTN